MRVLARVPEAHRITVYQEARKLSGSNTPTAKNITETGRALGFLAEKKAVPQIGSKKKNTTNLGSQSAIADYAPAPEQEQAPLWEESVLAVEPSTSEPTAQPLPPLPKASSETVTVVAPAVGQKWQRGNLCLFIEGRYLDKLAVLITPPDGNAYTRTVSPDYFAQAHLLYAS